MRGGVGVRLVQSSAGASNIQLCSPDNTARHMVTILTIYQLLRSLMKKLTLQQLVTCFDLFFSCGICSPLTLSLGIKSVNDVSCLHSPSPVIGFLLVILFVLSS